MRVEASVTFVADHPVFAGHFPDKPIVPGALLLDQVLHVAMLAIPASRQEPVYLPTDSPKTHCEISSVKFLSAVQPGETLLIACTVSAQRPTRFDITCQGRQIATGTLVLNVAE
jgi:3-hydroxyacyl-[acyl-carrier-protein] dehydratase